MCEREIKQGEDSENFACGVCVIVFRNRKSHLQH